MGMVIWEKMKKQLLNKREVANILSLSIGQVNYLIEQNKLETVEVKPGILRIKESSVVKYLNVKPEVGITLSRVFTILWAVAIIAFFLQLLITGNDDSNTAGSWTLLALDINICLGVIFFMAAVLTNVMKSTKYKLLPKNISIFWLSMWTTLYLLIATIPVFAEGSIESEKKTNLPTPTPTEFKYTPTPTPTPTQAKSKTQTNTTGSGSQIDCIGPDGKQFKTTMDECKKLNETWGKSVDYMLNCTYPSECGGGVKYIKKSECDKPCTRVTNGTNTVNNNQTNTTNYPPCTIYYPSSNRSETYIYQSPSDCQKLKDSVAAGSTQIVPTSSYVAPPVVTTTPYPTPTVDQAAIDARISRCKSDCISSVDSYIGSERHKAVARGGYDSYFDSILNSRSALITSCQSGCY